MQLLTSSLNEYLSAILLYDQQSVFTKLYLLIWITIYFNERKKILES